MIGISVKRISSIFRAKSLRRSLYIATTIFVLVVASSFLYSEFYPSAITEKTISSVRAGIESELAYLSTEGDKIAMLDNFAKAVHEEDSYTALSILVAEKDSRNIGLAGVTNENGNIFARTLSSQHRGDNAFINTPQGRSLASGATSTASVEQSGVNPKQLILTTGRFVYYGGDKVGALFTNHLADDKFMSRFVDRYLAGGSIALSYTKALGIYGISSDDQTIRRIVLAYFYPDSDWITGGRGGDVVRMPGGNVFKIINVPISGIEKPTGGIIVMVPVPVFSVLGVLLTGIIPCLIFFAVSFLIYKKEKRRRYYTLVLFLATTLGFATWCTFWLFRLSLIPNMFDVPRLYNSTLRLSPETGVYSPEFDFRSSIFLDTGEESVNAVEAVLTYDPDIIEVSSIDTSDSSCDFFLEESNDRAHGVIHISCIKIEEGFPENGTKIADLVMKGKVLGRAQVGFTKGTMVLADDGIGTDVLRTYTGASYVVEHQRDARATSSVEEIGGHEVIFSTTHPNPERWYRSRSIGLRWVPSGPAYVNIDTDISAVPTDIVDTGSDVYQKDVATDGQYFVHFKRGSNDKITTLPIKIDTVPPDNLSVEVSENSISTGEVVRVKVSASDDLSGLQKNFYVKIGDQHFFLPARSDLSIPFYKSGTYPIYIRVFDNAGNYSDSTTNITVTGNSLGSWLPF